MRPIRGTRQSDDAVRDFTNPVLVAALMFSLVPWSTHFFMMERPTKKKKKEEKEPWENMDFVIRKVREYSHHEKHTRKDNGAMETSIHVSVNWLKKAVEKFHEPGTKTFREHCMYLKLTSLKLHDEICGGFVWVEEPDRPVNDVNCVNVVLNQSNVIKDTALMRTKMESDVIAFQDEIQQKHKGMGNCDCNCLHACVSHEDQDAEAVRSEAVIRNSRGDEQEIKKKLAAFRFKTKRTKAKRRLSSVQKFAEKKGDITSNAAITVVAKMCDISQMDLFAWKTEVRERGKLSWIQENIRHNPVTVDWSTRSD